MRSGQGGPSVVSSRRPLPLVQTSVLLTGPDPGQEGGQGAERLGRRGVVGRLLDGRPARSPQQRPVGALALRGDPLPPARAEPAQEDRRPQTRPVQPDPAGHPGTAQPGHTAHPVTRVLTRVLDVTDSWIQELDPVTDDHRLVDQLQGERVLLRPHADDAQRMTAEAAHRADPSQDLGLQSGLFGITRGRDGQPLTRAGQQRDQRLVAFTCALPPVGGELDSSHRVHESSSARNRPPGGTRCEGKGGCGR